MCVQERTCCYGTRDRLTRRGSPVPSSYIYDEIIKLRAKNTETPLYAVVEDMAASGAYFVASAIEKIFVNQFRVVGSIGVRMDGFGAVKLFE